MNENADIVKDYPRYVMRITGNDKEGVEQLDSFIDPETKFPVIVTTSQLLSTGVDVQTCRVIALDREISSMTEFKQIVGRGTRIHEDTRKYYFTRWKKATRKQAVLEELEQAGLPIEALASEVGPDLDPFDLICHVAYDRPALTRRDRAENVRKRDVFTKYGPQARAVLEALLQKYQDEGVTDLDDPRILKQACPTPRPSAAACSRPGSPTPRLADALAPVAHELHVA